MKFLFWRKAKKKTPAQQYKGINAHCFKHPFAARCMCNRCILCIENETGLTVGSITYAGKPNSGLLMCNDCLKKYSNEELAEYYAMFSAKEWDEPVCKEVVESTLIRNFSHSAIRRYKEDGKYITEVKDLETGSVSKSWTT